MAVTLVFTGAPNGGKPGGGYVDVLPSAWTSFSGINQPQVGDIILVWCVFDNLTSTTPAVASIQKAPGETNSWVQLADYDSNVSPGAGAGTRGELWGIEVSVASGWTSTLSITTTGGTIAAATTMCFTFREASLSVRGFQVNSVTAAVIGNAGDLVMGMAGSEGNSALPGDADTFAGAWSTPVTHNTTGAGGASNVTSIFQYKIPTSNGTQQYSAGSLTDGYGIAIALMPAGSSGAGSGTATWTGSASGVNGNSGFGSHTWATSAVGDAPNPECIEDLQANPAYNLYLGEDESFEANITHTQASVSVGDTILIYIALNNQDATNPQVSWIDPPPGVSGTWEKVYAFSSSASGKWTGFRGELWGFTTQTAWAGAKYSVVHLTGSGATIATVLSAQWRNIGLVPLATAFDNGTTPWSASASAAAGTAVIGMYTTDDNATIGSADSDTTGGAGWSQRWFNTAEYPTWPTIEKAHSGWQNKIPASSATQSYDMTSSSGTSVGILGLVVLGTPPTPAPQTASGTMRWTTRARGGNGRLYGRYLADVDNGWTATSNYIDIPSWQQNSGGFGPSTPQAGDNLVWVIGYNATNASSPSITSITKPGSETASWVKLAEWSDGVSTRFEAWTIRATYAWADQHCRVNFSGNVGNKIDARWVIRGNYGNGLELKEAVGVDVGTSPWAPTVSTAEAGDVLLGFLSVKSNTATTNYSADADSTNAYWSASTRALSNTGTSATSLSKIAQHKDVTGSGTQTWDTTCTDTTSTGIAAVLVLAPTDVPTGDLGLSGAGTLTLAGNPGHTGTTALSGTGALVPVADQLGVAGSTAFAGEGTVELAAAVELQPPANLTVTVVSPTQLDISWDASINATGYDLERDGVIISNNQPGLTYNDTGLTEGTTYTYRVRAQKVQS